MNRRFKRLKHRHIVMSNRETFGIPSFEIELLRSVDAKVSI